MTLRQFYRHRQGRVYAVQPTGKDRLMTGAEVEAALASHKAGAEDISFGPLVARISRQAAEQLKSAIAATEHFNQLQARRGKSSTAVAIAPGSAA